MGRGLISSNDCPPKDIFDFWIFWLLRIQIYAFPEADGFRSSPGVKGWTADREMRRPIQELIDAIEDMKSGVRTKYTEACFIKRKKGDRTDVKEVADHKKRIAMTCRLLTEIGFRTQADAVKRINKELERAGMRHEYTVDSVKKWIKFFPHENYEIYARAYIRSIIQEDSNILIDWNNISYEERQDWNYICENTPVEKLIELWTNTVESVRLSLPDRIPLEKYKILRLWTTILRVHSGLWIATRYDKECYERFGI